MQAKQPIPSLSYLCKRTILQYVGSNWESNQCVIRSLALLPEQHKAHLMHLFERKRLLQNLGKDHAYTKDGTGFLKCFVAIYQRFFDEPERAKLQYATKRSYLGLMHENNGQWKDPYFFIYVS